VVGGTEEQKNVGGVPGCEQHGVGDSGDWFGSVDKRQYDEREDEPHFAGAADFRGRSYSEVGNQ